jgi:hypothetical protein
MISFLYELSDTTNSYHHVVVVYDVLEGIKEMINQLRLCQRILIRIFLNILPADPVE